MHQPSPYLRRAAFFWLVRRWSGLLFCGDFHVWWVVDASSLTHQSYNASQQEARNALTLPQPETPDRADCLSPGALPAFVLLYPKVHTSRFGCGVMMEACLSRG
jgi:hypothetical protein